MIWLLVWWNAIAWAHFWEVWLGSLADEETR